MATRYQGRGKSALVVDGEYVVIEHDGGVPAPTRVHQSSISGAHFEPATRFTAGIITIAVDGAPLTIPTGNSVGSDPWTVLFKHGGNDTFRGLHLWLDQLVAYNERPA